MPTPFAARLLPCLLGLVLLALLCLQAVRQTQHPQGVAPVALPGGGTWSMVVVTPAAQVLGAQGVYRVPTGRGFLYMPLMSVQRAA